MGKRELIVMLNLSSWCLVMVERLFLAVPRGCLQFVIVVLPDHTHLLFLLSMKLLPYPVNQSCFPSALDKSNETALRRMVPAVTSLAN